MWSLLRYTEYAKAEIKWLENIFELDKHRAIKQKKNSKI